MPRVDRVQQPLCADIDEFSLHAAMQVEAHDRKRLEQLCRDITRPAPSDERVQLKAAGQVELKLKTPWSDGTTHLVMCPLEFMQRLAALAVAAVASDPVPRRAGPMPGCARWWCRRIPRYKRRPPQPLLRLVARQRRFSPGPTASAGRGCSSASSKSTCSTARTAVPGS
jgi:Putative transposase